MTTGEAVGDESAGVSQAVVSGAGDDGLRLSGNFRFVFREIAIATPWCGPPTV